MWLCVFSKLCVKEGVASHPEPLVLHDSFTKDIKRGAGVDVELKERRQNIFFARSVASAAPRNAIL